MAVAPSCRHRHTTDGPHYGYTASVAVPGRTESHRAAHGGITTVQTCAECGATRRINRNGPHEEHGVWHHDADLPPTP